MSINGKVVRYLSQYEVVINLGSKDGVKPGDSVLIYRLDEEVVDPDTQENLGQLEIVRGKGSVKHVQDRLATVASVEKQVVRKSMYGIGPVDEVSERLPFVGVTVGDLARIT